MRIALVTRRYPPLLGGAEKMLAYLADALAHQGAEVFVLTSRLPADTPATEGTNPRIVRLKTSGIRFFGTFLYMKHVRKWFSNNKIDIAYVSMLKHDAFATLGSARKREFPVILRPEGAGRTGDLAWHTRATLGMTIRRRCREARRFVSISQAIRNELVAAGFPAERIVDLPNGVPIPQAPWSPPISAEREGPAAAFVGRLAPEKNLENLLRAWKLVRVQIPQAELALAGEGVAEAGLRNLAKTLGIASAVKFAGKVSDVPAFLRAADVFVLPSIEEGMSIALLEALALGMPTVASNIPGNRAIVEHEKHGLLANPHDPGELAQAILRQLTDRQTAAQMGARGRSMAIEAYSIEAVAKRHLELFDQILRLERAKRRTAH